MCEHEFEHGYQGEPIVFCVKCNKDADEIYPGMPYVYQKELVDHKPRFELKYAKRHPKTIVGFFLCWIGLHRWRYHNYRTCRRCGRTQTLYEYSSGAKKWDD